MVPLAAAPEGAATLPAGAIPRSGVVWWDYRLNKAAVPTTILTVSAGKTFLLTDVVFSNTGNEPYPCDVLGIGLLEGSVLKTKFSSCNFTDASVHYNTGIPFSSGKNVRVDQLSRGPTPIANIVLSITITGYEY